MISPALILRTATQPAAAMPTIINGVELVPALNGSLVNLNDCTVHICSMDLANLRYIPSQSGNMAYLIIFAVFLVAQLILGPVYRTWGFLTGMFCGLLLEILGYVGRLQLHSNVFDFNGFVLYLVCLTIGPAFISASIYLCLSRIVVAYGQNIARFSAKSYTLVFVCCDIISLVLQAAGGAIAASSEGGSSSEQSGVNIMIAGLATQVVSLTLFIILGLDFVFAARHARKSDLNPAFRDLRSRGLFRLLPWGLALATITIYIRCCFRVAELKNGFGGSIANNQTLFMIFEGPMIMVAALSLTVFHPGACFGGAQGWRAANWTWKTKADRTSLQSDELSSLAHGKRKVNRAAV